MAQGLTDLSHALALRLRDVARLIDRLDRLEAGTGDWLAGQGADELRAAAQDMTLRALRQAADPGNFAILNCLAVHTALPMGDLERLTGQNRLGLNERVSDLIQVGLAARNIDTDHVQATPAGLAVVGLITSIFQATAERLAVALQPVTR